MEGVTVKWVKDRAFGLETLKLSAAAEARIHKFVESVFKSG